jgi:predicted nucleic acid-binding protein
MSAQRESGEADTRRNLKRRYDARHGDSSHRGRRRDKGSRRYPGAYPERREFSIEKECVPVASLAAPEPEPRLLSEAVAAFQRREAEMDEIPVLDPEFAEAVEEPIRSRRPRDLSRWDLSWIPVLRWRWKRGLSPSASFAEIAKAAGDIRIALSVLTIFELMHGVERAKTETQARRQLTYVDPLCRELPVFPIFARNCKNGRANRRRAGLQGDCSRSRRSFDWRDSLGPVPKVPIGTNLSY